MDGAIFKSKVIKKKSQAFMTISEQLEHVDHKRKRNLLVCIVLLCLLLLWFGGSGESPVESPGVLGSSKKTVLIAKHSDALALLHFPEAQTVSDFVYTTKRGGIVSIPSGTACRVLGESFKEYPSLKAHAHGQPFLWTCKVKVSGKIMYAAEMDVKKTN